MIKLTDRLQTIANEIHIGETVADIGTDHGFLPIYLWEQGVSPKVIMADISSGSLKKAEDNCNYLHQEESFDLRLGSGIKVLNVGEVDAVVIAGMGGMLMAEILEDDLHKAKSFKKLILQPRTQVGFLRHWLCNNGFSIIKEQLVREGRFICEVITAIPREEYVISNLPSNSIEYEYPSTLIDFANPLTEEYLSNRLNREEDVLTSMKKGSNVTDSQLREQEYRIEYLKGLIERVKNGL
jgi:tRNA (adenine22-N1)-methyltransferase